MSDCGWKRWSYEAIYKEWGWSTIAESVLLPLACESVSSTLDR